jgi:hypothetical protein
MQFIFVWLYLCVCNPRGGFTDNFPAHCFSHKKVKGRNQIKTDYEATDFETVVCDLLTGQYDGAVQVVSFNSSEGWSRDVSEDIAKELRRRCDLQLRGVPSSIQGFVERYEGHGRRLSLRLA